MNCPECNEKGRVITVKRKGAYKRFACRNDHHWSLGKLTRAQKGHRRGESHYKVKLSDDDVRLMRELREHYGFSYAKIGEKFECSMWTVRDIVNYATRV